MVALTAAAALLLHSLDSASIFNFFFYAGLHFLIHEWASHPSTSFTTLTAAVETQRPTSTQIRRLLALDTLGPGPR